MLVGDASERLPPAWWFAVTRSRKGWGGGGVCASPHLSKPAFEFNLRHIFTISTTNTSTMVATPRINLSLFKVKMESVLLSTITIGITAAAV